jgi:hypothetical protein
MHFALHREVESRRIDQNLREDGSILDFVCPSASMTAVNYAAYIQAWLRPCKKHSPALNSPNQTSPAKGI